jgi:MFS family permease
MFFLGLAVGGVGFALSLQMGVNSNFVRDVMGLSGQQQGMLEAWREGCGITALLILVLLVGLAEPLVAACVLALTGVGLAWYTFVPDYFYLVAASLVWSQGLHVWFPLPQSMALAMAEPGRESHRLGQMRSAGAIGSGAGLLGAYILNAWLDVPIRPLFLVAGAAALLAAASCLAIPRNIRTPGPRFVLRRRYWLYYLLSFLEGWRKQIFVAFAGFLLVMKYNTPLLTMLRLWMAIQVIGYVGSPLVGRLIDRVGERPVLVGYFGFLTVFFVGYGTIDNEHALYVLYVVDSAMFIFAMALTTFANRMVPPASGRRRSAWA